MSAVMESRLDERIDSALDAEGCAIVRGLLSPSQCREMASLYADGERFRSRVVMARHGFGRGEYQYFTYPLPEPIAELRATLYPRLAEIANGWNAAMGIATRYPAEHAEFLARCHDAGQTRPTPLLRTNLMPSGYACVVRPPARPMISASRSVLVRREYVPG